MVHGRYQEIIRNKRGGNIDEGNTITVVNEAIVVVFVVGETDDGIDITVAERGEITENSAARTVHTRWIRCTACKRLDCIGWVVEHLEKCGKILASLEL